MSKKFILSLFLAAVVLLAGVMPAPAALKATIMPGDGTVTGTQNALGINNGRRVAIIGDSQVAYNIYQVGTDTNYTPNGLLAALQNRWGHRFYFDPALNKGVGGETSAQVLTRYNTDVAANYSRFDWLIIQCGANDATQAIAASTTVANIQTMADAAVKNGKRVIIISPFPRSTWTGAASTTNSRNIMLNQRKRLADYVASTRNKVILIDAFPDLVNPASATSDPITSPIAAMADGLHASSGGMFSLAARRMAAVLDAHVPPRPYRFSGAADAYDATHNPYGNLLSNAAFLTTSGGTISNGSGTMPSGWTLTRYSGSYVNGEVVASNIAGAAGYDSQSGAKTRIAVNIASGKSSNEIAAVQIITRITTGFTPGVTRMFAACEVELSTVANMKSIYLNVNERDSVPTTLKQYGDGLPQITSSNFLYPESQKWFLRTPEFTVNANTASIGLNVQAAFDASSAGATANVDISACELRAISN